MSLVIPSPNNQQCPATGRMVKLGKSPTSFWGGFLHKKRAIAI